ncbi:MAG: SDR family oxidoreductase [Pseudomonadota bacterium]
MKEQSFLITGGGSGIGAVTAKHLAAQGARVTICGRRAEKLQAVAADIGEACLPVTADVTDTTDRESLINAAVKHGGGLNGLINNAGNMYRTTIEDADADKLLELFNHNVVAGMMLSGLAVPYLEQTAGSIIFIGSIHTRRAFPGASPYAATKAAVQTVTQVLAAELGPRNIRVNCVIPGAVPTEINQRAGLFSEEEAADRYEQLGPLHVLGRIGTAEEVAEAIAYLLNAKWTTGALLDVDGGLGLGATGL